MNRMHKKDSKLPIDWRGEAEWILSTAILLAFMVWATVTQAKLA